MPSQLCLSVTFLDPSFHGRGDGAEPEWPPSPLRLFQALVAAAHAASRHEASLSDRAVAALRWLEQQPAPVIVAPAGRLSQAYRLSVPNNAMDVVAGAWSRGNETGKDANPATHRAMKMVEGTSLVDGDMVHYLWPLSEPLTSDIRDLADSLCCVAQNLVALGWGIDMAIGCGRIITDSENEVLSGERWFPIVRQGKTSLRTPVTGTLAALQQRHQQFLQRVTSEGGFAPVPALTMFRPHNYAREQDKPARPFAAFQFLHTQEQRFRSFRATQTAKVAAMVRHTVGNVAAETEHTEAGVSSAQWLDQYVHGHDRTNDTTLGRFAYLPLPTIDPRGVASGIRRVLIAEPTDGRGHHATWVKRMLAGQPLINLQTQCDEAFLAPTAAHDSVVSRYVSHAREWATVTPVVLPWGDSGKPHRAEKQFLKALRHAGYSATDLDNLELRREPFWRGAELARQYFTPKHLQGTASWHVRLRWKHDFAGPLAIGSGRFCGLGLFAVSD